MKNILLGCFAFFILGTASAQSLCAPDFDFGIETSGISPNPTLGEQFAPAILLQPYNDVLHILIPTYVLEIDSTLPFAPDALLDSIELVSIVMVDLSDTLNTYSLPQLGLDVFCNNNGDSGYECSFLGGNQYCASLEGTPFIGGNFRADITVKGWVTVFGFPFGQEQLFGSLNLDIGTEGCMDPAASNYDPAAVLDDGSCDTVVACFGDLNNDSSVTVADLLLILSEFGCVAGCTTDINNDGVTSVADLLELLSVFGTTC